MPLILSPADAAMAIGAKCGAGSPDADDPQLVSILSGVTPRVEGAMNVNSLTRGTHIDRFYLKAMPLQGDYGPVRTSVRLSNGYLTDTPLTLRDEDGVVVTDEDALPVANSLDRELGTFDFKEWDRGYYSLEYESGFEVDTTTDTYIDVPRWMKDVATIYLVSWFRRVYVTPKIPKGVSIAGLLAGLDRELMARVYEKYQRPRANMVWADARM